MLEQIKRKDVKYNLIATGILSVLTLAILFYLREKRQLFGVSMEYMHTHPKDYAMQPFYFWLTQILVVLSVVLIWYGLVQLYRAICIKKQWAWLHSFLLPWFCIWIVYFVDFLTKFPGDWQDETLVLYYAYNYLPVYWHNYLTSLFHMVSITLIPSTLAPLLLMQLLLSGVYASAFFMLYQKFGKTKWRFLIFVFALTPHRLYEVVNSHYAVIYNIFFLGLLLFLIYEWKSKAKCTWPKLLLIAVWTAVAAVWRAAGMVYLVFVPILLVCIYKKQIHWKRMVLYIVSSLVIFTAVKMPQKLGDDKFYGKDYTLINTLQLTSVMLSREQTYEGAQEDIANIDALIDVDWILKFPETALSYQNYNGYMYDGQITQTFSTPKEQDAYVKSFFRMCLHNPDLVIKERINNFLTTCDKTHLKLDYGFSVGNEEIELPEDSSRGIVSFQRDKITAINFIEEKAGFQIQTPESWKQFFSYIKWNYKNTQLYYNGIIWFFVIMPLLAIWMLIKRNMFCFWMAVALLARGCLVFLVAPAAFSIYYMPMVTGGCLLLLFTMAWSMEKKEGTKKKKVLAG